jgi:hypothetical protein
MQLVDKHGSTAYYVGESDALSKRLQYHRRTMPSRMDSVVRSATIAGLPTSEKSTAKMVERALQRTLFDQVCKLWQPSTNHHLCWLRIHSHFIIVVHEISLTTAWVVTTAQCVFLGNTYPYTWPKISNQVSLCKAAS